MNKRLLIQPTAAVQPGDIWVFRCSNGVTAFQRPRDGSLYLKHGKTIQPLTESELKALVAAAVEQTQIAQEVDRLLPGLPKVARATVIQNVHAKTSLVNAATAQVALDKICHRGGVR